MLTNTGLKIEEFENKIILPKVPIDELGLLVIARMYHTHFGVVLKDRVCYTTDDNTATCSKFMLMYQGGVSFSDTCTGNWDHPSPPPLILVLDEEQPQQKSPVNLARPLMLKAAENCASMVPLDMRNNRGIETHEKSDEEPNMDLRMDQKTESDQNPIKMMAGNLNRMTKWIYPVYIIQRQILIMIRKWILKLKAKMKWIIMNRN